MNKFQILAIGVVTVIGTLSCTYSATKYVLSMSSALPAVAQSTEMVTVQPFKPFETKSVSDPVINVDTVVIVGRRFQESNQRSTLTAPKPVQVAFVPDAEDHDPLHAKDNNWDCKIGESAFGGMIRSCGPRITP